LGSSRGRKFELSRLSLPLHYGVGTLLHLTLLWLQSTPNVARLDTSIFEGLKKDDHEDIVGDIVVFTVVAVAQPTWDDAGLGGVSVVKHEMSLQRRCLTMLFL